MNEEYTIIKPIKTEKDKQHDARFTEEKVGLGLNISTALRGYLFTRTYGVTIENYDAQKDKTSKIQFEMEITLRNFPGEKYYEYTLDKKQVFINKKKPITIVEKLAVQTLRAVYPLEVQTNAINKPVAVLNHQEILERWKTIKAVILKEFTGNAITNYVSKMEKALNSEAAILRSLQEELFYSLLFNDINSKYGSEQQKETSINFPLLGFKQPLVFKGTQKLNTYKTYYQTALVEFEANLKNEDVNANLKIEYDLESKSFVLENCTAQCLLKHKDTLLKSVTVKVYHLKEKPTLWKYASEMQSEIRQRHRKRRKNEKAQEPKKGLKEQFYNWLNT